MGDIAVEQHLSMHEKREILGYSPIECLGKSLGVKALINNALNPRIYTGSIKSK